MRTVSCILRAVLAVLLLVPEILWAGGEPQADRPAGGGRGQTAATIQAYWILDEGAGNAEMLLERFYLPTSLSVLRWTEFRVTAEGVELASAGGYRVTRKEPLVTERWQQAVLHGYTVRVSFTGEPDRPSGSSRTVSTEFSYDTARQAGTGGGSGATVAPQPLQQALLKAIQSTGKKSGLARVLELEYRGRGRFRARVEIQ